MILLREQGVKFCALPLHVQAGIDWLYPMRLATLIVTRKCYQHTKPRLRLVPREHTSIPTTCKLLEYIHVLKVFCQEVATINFYVLQIGDPKKGLFRLLVSSKREIFLARNF